MLKNILYFGPIDRYTALDTHCKETFRFYEIRFGETDDNPNDTSFLAGRMVYSFRLYSAQWTRENISYFDAIIDDGCMGERLRDCKLPIYSFTRGNITDAIRSVGTVLSGKPLMRCIVDAIPHT